MIRKCGVPSTTGKSALGDSSVIFTSCLPLAVISFIGAASALAAEPVAGSLWRASVEFDVAAQLDRPHRGAVGLDRLGELELRRQAGIKPRQAVVEGEAAG